MRRTVLSTSIILILCCIALRPALAQPGAFDMQAYRSFLQQHENMSGNGLLATYPSPLLLDRIPAAAGEPAYLDLIRSKFQLTADEQRLLSEHGFVVTERLRPPTFQQALLDVWMRDLPLFVSTDAILHALHLSYDEILADLEKARFAGSLGFVLDALRQYQITLDAAYAATSAMQPSLRDVDLYISVARAMLLGDRSTFYPENADECDEVLNYASALQPVDIPLFGSVPRTYDFSQLAIRGHYSRTPLLGRYFQAMMWLGRTELMLTAPVTQGAYQPSAADIQRQVIDAALLLEALEGSTGADTLRSMDVLLTSIVGESDNVTPAQLRQVMTTAGAVNAAGFLDPARVARLQAELASGSFGAQRINSQILCSDPMNPEQLQPPAAFLLMGQRFVIDSYVMANVVFDRVMHQGTKVKRMKPATMDVLFALGNNAAAQFLTDEMNSFPYAQNLNALRYLIDSHDDGFWNATMYSGWLNAIRAINIPSDVVKLPDFMQTAAWWQLKMNTQLSSWAQLRHDNLLYAKQSYTGGVTCSFPEMYFEPIPEFYRRVSLLTSRMQTLFAAEGMPRQANFFGYFSSVMDTIQTISEKELAHQALTETEKMFARQILFLIPNCGTATDGWFQKLIYGLLAEEPVDIIVADVHTAPTDAQGNITGWVLHAGTGLLNMGVFVVPDNNGMNTAYIGPVLSYHEHESTNFERLTDEVWKQGILADSYPRPAWTNLYLADRDGRRKAPGPSLRTDSPPVKKPWLECTASAPALVVDNANVRYVPMPFPLTVAVTNSGDALTDSVFATIIFPPDLSLAADDTLHTKPLQKARLFPQQQSKVEWMLRHPPSTVEKSYTVKVLVWTSNADSAACETTVIIPPLDSPVLAPRCYVPDSLHFDDTADSYIPNPFTVRLTCVNTGGAPAHEVTGTLVLPANVELLNPNDSLTRYFAPSPMDQWQIGDPVPALTWIVHWVPRLRHEALPEFRFTVTGKTFEGILLDSVEVRCQTRVPGLLPYFNCRHWLPDSLALRADGLDVEPNPFSTRWVLMNRSHQTGCIKRVFISFPPDGLSLNPASPMPMDLKADITVAPGDSAVFEWLIDVENRITRRYVQFNYTAIDDEGNPISCVDWLPIANLKTALSDSCLGTSVRVLHYLPAENDYDTRQFVISTKLRNGGGATLHDLVAEIEWTDASGQDLIEFDPDFAGDNVNPKSHEELFPQQSMKFEWGFRLKNPNTTGIPQRVAFNLKYGSKETPYIVNGCETVVEIEPAGVTAAGGPPAAERCVLYPNHPNPFGTETTIRFALAAPASVSLVVKDALGRELRRLIESEYRGAGSHAVRFDARDLRPGIYFYRLSAGETTLIGRMLLLR